MFLHRTFTMVLTLAALVTMLAAAPASAQTASKPTPESFIGNRLPDFLLSSPNGAPGRLSDHAGKVVFLEFWATWCPDCRAVAPHVQALYDKYGKSGLDIVAVSIDTKPETVAGYMVKNTFSYPVLMATLEAKTMFRVLRIPTAYLIDRGGIVRAVYVEYGEKGAPEVEAKVKELLGKGTQ